MGIFNKKEKYNNFLDSSIAEIEKLMDEENYLSYGKGNLTNTERLNRLDEIHFKMGEIYSEVKTVTRKVDRSNERFEKIFTVLAFVFFIEIVVMFIVNFIIHNFTGSFINLICILINLKSIIKFFKRRK